MGDLAFNEPFHLLSPTGGSRSYSSFVRKGMQIYATLSSVPWIAPITSYLLISADIKTQARAFSALGKEQYRKRRSQGTEPNDLFSHLIAGETGKGEGKKEADLEADCPTIIIAGSDTSSITMTFLFFFMLRDREVYSRLREEVDGLWDGKSKLEGGSLGPDQAPYLNGCINEALRIWPPGPNGMQRMTPKEGHVVDGRWIPGNTHVWNSLLPLLPCLPLTPSPLGLLQHPRPAPLRLQLQLPPPLLPYALVPFNPSTNMEARHPGVHPLHGRDLQLRREGAGVAGVETVYRAVDEGV